jgi:hypothetical protein
MDEEYAAYLAKKHGVEYIGPFLDDDNRIIFHGFNDETRSTFVAKDENEFIQKITKRKENLCA